MAAALKEENSERGESSHQSTQRCLSDSESYRKVKKCKLNGDSTYGSHVSSLSNADTSTNISEWNALDLPHFGLKFEKCTEIEDTFFKGISHFAEKKEWSARAYKYGFRSEEDNEKRECFQHAINNILNIDCNNIDEIDVGEVLRIKQIIEDSHWIAEYAEDSCVKNSICRELSSSLKNFIWQLLFMGKRQNKDDFQELSDGMFQELFVYFARIFCLNIVNGRSVPKYSFSVCGKDFVGTPDAILCHPTDSKTEKICAIMQVKGYKQDEDLEQVRNVQNMSRARHIRTSLQGQHGGHFLCSLPFSVFGNSGMYGFIVQGTKVTLTSFKAEDGYYNSLCNGCLQNKRATIQHSREYNILRKDDRKQLVQTFLDIGKLLEFLRPHR